MVWLVVGMAKVCVMDAKTGEPVSGAYVRGKRDWNITDGSGCTELKYTEDTVIVVRIGYKSVKVPFSDTVRLKPSPLHLRDVEVVAVKAPAVEHLPFQVDVENKEDVSGVFGPALSSAEVSTSAYGTEYAKPVFRGFSLKRLTVLRDGFEVRDLSSGSDHPLHLYGGDVGSVTLVKGSAGAVFGGGFGGTIYVKSREAEFSKVFHRLGLHFTPNGQRVKGSYLVNVGNDKIALLLGGDAGISEDYISGSGKVPNSFGRDFSVSSRMSSRVWGFVPSLGLRYDVRSWGIPEESAVSHSTHSETFFIVGDAGVNYQNTLQVEMCGRDTITSIRKEVLQGKYGFTFKNYNGVIRIIHESMDGGEVKGASKMEGYLSLYGPVFVRENLQILAGIGGKVVGRQGDFSGMLGLSSSLLGTSVGISLARSFRFPTLYEMRFVGPHHGVGRYDVGNPDLRKEISHEVQINIRRKFGNFILSLGSFANYVDGFITVVPTGEEYVDDEGHRMGVYRWENRDALFWGYTSKLSFATSHGYVALTYAYLHANLLHSNDTLLYLPVPEIRLGGKVSKGMYFSKFLFRYMTEYGKVVGDMSVGITPGRYAISVGVFNPLNVEWSEPSDPLGTPIPGRSFYVSLKAATP